MSSFIFLRFLLCYGIFVLLKFLWFFPFKERTEKSTKLSDKAKLDNTKA